MINKQIFDTTVKTMYNAGKNSQEITMKIWCEYKTHGVSESVDRIKLQVEDALLRLHRRPA
jgi:hypothetical protein